MHDSKAVATRPFSLRIYSNDTFRAVSDMATALSPEAKRSLHVFDRRRRAPKGGAPDERLSLRSRVQDVSSKILGELLPLSEERSALYSVQSVARDREDYAHRHDEGVVFVSSP